MWDFESYLPTRILFGNKKIEETGRQVKPYGDKALLVTGKKSMKAFGFTDQITEILQSEGTSVHLFNQVESNPDRETVIEGGKVARESGSQVIIGLGGGSALDAAKGIAILAKENKEIWDYIGENKVARPVLPVIAIPSTAGTGSEVTQYSVISDKTKKLKEVITSEYIFPRVAMIDPNLMRSASPNLTARAGVDCLAHAIEAYLSKFAQPLSDQFALESINLCAKYLRQVVSDGEDLKARAGMGWASTVAGMAIALADVIVAHPIAEAIGALFDTHHGATVGVLLPYAMEFNLPQQTEKLAEIAHALGEDITGLTSEQKALKSIQGVRTLLQNVQLPQRLRDIGVTEDSIPDIVKLVLQPGSDKTAGNPREVTQKNLTKFIEKAL